MMAEIRTPSPRDKRVMQLYKLRKSMLATLLTDIRAAKGRRMIYGTPYIRWIKHDLVSEILREEGWNVSMTNCPFDRDSDCMTIGCAEHPRDAQAAR